MHLVINLMVMHFFFFHPLLRFFFFKLMKSMVLHRGSYFCATDEKKYQKKSTVKVDSMSVLFHARSLNEYYQTILFWYWHNTIPGHTSQCPVLSWPSHSSSKLESASSVSFILSNGCWQDVLTSPEDSRWENNYLMCHWRPMDSEGRLCQSGCYVLQRIRE